MQRWLGVKEVIQHEFFLDGHGLDVHTTYRRWSNIMTLHEMVATGNIMRQLPAKHFLTS